MKNSTLYILKELGRVPGLDMVKENGSWRFVFTVRERGFRRELVTDASKIGAKPFEWWVDTGRSFLHGAQRELWKQSGMDDATIEQLLKDT